MVNIKNLNLWANNTKVVVPFETDDPCEVLLFDVASSQEKS